MSVQEVNHQIDVYPPILIVEPDDEFAHILSTRIERVLGCMVVRVTTMQAGLERVQAATEHFLLAMVEPHLPDAPEGEIVDYLLSMRIPVILFSQVFNEGDREDILVKGVVDYVIKTGEYNLTYMVRLVDRIRKNRFIHVLIVDDSRSTRVLLRNLLERRLFVVRDAPSGEIALQVLKEDARIKMVLIDYQMPGMDGFQLTQRIRETYSEQEMVVVGLSSYGNNILSAKFIKHGANDFISKPFLVEEFFCRIDHSISDMETFNDLKNVYIRDFLTGLFNRLYLFEVGKQLLANEQIDTASLFTIMVGVDEMKQVNQTFGYEVGDAVIRAVARTLSTQFYDVDMITRVGGAEFCLLSSHATKEKLAERLELFLKLVSQWSMRVGGEDVRITVSCGVFLGSGKSVSDLVYRAAALLYQGKKQGGNQILWGDVNSVAAMPELPPGEVVHA